MKSLLTIGFPLFISSFHAFSQEFDAKDGYIFDQKYVTRITEAKASDMLAIKNSGDVFWELYNKDKSSLKLPEHVKIMAEKVIFSAEGVQDLSLKSYVHKGDSDSGDSQKFSYVSDLKTHHLAVVEFDHDRPCFILIDKKSLQVYFVDYASL